MDAIKKFNEFILESTGGDEITISLREEDLDLFKREPILSNLIDKEKISISMGNLTYNKNDKSTIESLEGFIDLNKK